MKIKLLLVLLLTASHLFAEEYPFDLPEDMTATVNINTTSQEPFNNLLLGTNIHDLAHSEGQAMVRDFDPITVRFPHGLFANWYDWEQDKARVYGTDQFTYTKDDGSSRTVELSFLSSIKTMDNNNLLVGINSLNTLNNEKKTATGKGYDMMWTFNMSADGTDYTNGSPVSVARYQDLINSGFEVKAIEMGNENFYAGQRSSIIPNPSDYIARAKSMYTALKALDSDLKLSVNLERKSNPANIGWNTEITNAGTDYFDAVSVHTYVGSDPDNAADSNEAYSVALTAREVLRKTIDNYSKVVAPDKPIWLTEWGVKSGGPNAVSALGMADCYMFMSENQDTYERANWFSVNGKLNSHLVWHDVNGKQVIKEPMEQTSYGSTYQIIRSVYENSILLGSEMTVPTLEGNINSVNARAVKKEGKTLLFVINLSDQEVPFSINIDGQKYYGEFTHKAMAFSSMADEITLPYGTDPLNLIKEGRGAIYLPKYSISTIELVENETVALDFMKLENGAVIDKGSNQTIEAAIGAEFKEISLWVNDVLLSTITEAPYQWSSFPALTNMMDPSYSLKLVAKTIGDEEIEKSISISTPKQWAYSEAYKPHAIPGKIEIEDYDYGGDGFAYYDRTPQNTASYTYRGNDNVDFNSTGTATKDLKAREWIEYTVDVAYSGYYDLLVSHETRRSPDFAAMTFSFVQEGETLFEKLICSNTGSGIYAVDTFKNAYLEKGRHILRLDILSYGFDLDYFEWVMTSNAIDYHNVGTLASSLNPDSYDKGTAVQYLKVPKDSLGFEFSGWFTNAECTDTIMVPVIAATDDVEMTFYAKWTPKPLAGSVVVYGDVTEGSLLSVNLAQIKDNSGILLYQWQQTVNENVVDIPGANSSTYTLVAGDVGKKLSVVVSSTVQSGSVVSNTTNLILETSATTYTILYNANNGTDGSIVSETVGTGGYPTFIANPSNEGYSISVWTNAQGDTLDAQSVITSDTTLYAQWVVGQRYKVRFNMGDTWEEFMTDNYPASISMLPADPMQADSLFDKWYTADGERFYDTYLIFNDLDIYPAWTVKTFPLNVVSSNGQIIFSPKKTAYDIHSEVSVTAMPNNKYEFVGWSGDYEGSDSVFHVTMDSTVNLVANYKQLPYYSLYVFSSKGDVKKVPYSSLYVSGSMVQLTATPDAGYEFTAWSGGYVGTENPLSLLMTENVDIYANFQLKTTALEQVVTSRVLVIPNPNEGVFTIDLGEDKSGSYKLYSLNGTEIQRGLVNSQEEIYIASPRSGVYMLEVNSERNREILKVIIK